MADYQDWKPVVLRKKETKPKTQAQQQQAVQKAFAEGKAVDVQKKTVSGSNKQHAQADGLFKLDDNEGEIPTVEHVSLSLSRTIQKARSDLKLTQKELATKINEKPNIINDYESGRAIPNNQILGKLERVLMVKLRGKEIGKKIEPRTPK